MTRSLEALKAAFTQKTSNGGGNQNWKLFFPFWKADTDTTSTVRFLPDADDENSLGFLVENLTHELIINGEKKKVPCLHMYGESCPICDLSRKYYDEGNETLGKRYYKKRGYIGQILVLDSPIEHDQNQLIKLIEFGPKIFKRIQAAFQSGDLEEAPYELKGGYNFRINKTKSGQYADYGTSSFAPKATDVDDDVIEQLNLYDLKEYREKHVDSETLMAMLIADQTGRSFDETSTAEQEEQHEEPVVEKEVPVAKTEKVEEKTESSTTSSKAQSVLEQLRARAKAAKVAE